MENDLDKIWSRWRFLRRAALKNVSMKHWVLGLPIRHSMNVPRWPSRHVRRFAWAQAPPAPVKNTSDCNHFEEQAKQMMAKIKRNHTMSRTVRLKRNEKYSVRSKLMNMTHLYPSTYSFLPKENLKTRIFIVIRGSLIIEIRSAMPYTNECMMCSLSSLPTRVTILKQKKGIKEVHWKIWKWRRITVWKRINLISINMWLVKTCK
jgi:hypothetical protein